MMMKPCKPTLVQPPSQLKKMEGKKWYKLIEQSFNVKELDYWEQYGIDTKTLQRFM